MPNRRNLTGDGPEAQLHRAVVTLLAARLPVESLVHHSPNEGLHHVSFRQKLAAFGMKAGWPDLEILCRGQLYFLELKAPKGTVTAIQRRIHTRIREAGFPVTIIRTLTECEAWLTTVLHGHPDARQGESDSHAATQNSTGR